jgi:hypothetical protein
VKRLNDIQINILRALTFVEPFDTLVQEIAAPEPVIGAELKSLISKRLVQVMHNDPKTGTMKRSFYFDGDNMRAFSYVITSQGMDLL